MPKINVYLPDALADAVRDAKLPVSAICQSALERAVRDVTSARGTDEPPAGDQAPVGVFSKFTVRAREAVTLAEQAARCIPHDYVGTEHLLLGLVDQGTNLAIRVLAALEIETEDLVAELTASMPEATRAPSEQVPFTPRAKRALEETAKEAMLLGHNYIGCEHILLGLTAVEDGIASQVLRRMGADTRTTRRAVTTALAGFVHATTQPKPASASASHADPMAEILRRLDAIEKRLSN